MNNFHIMLEISATIVSIQNFFLEASQTHEKFSCTKESTCNVGQFLKKLAQILRSDKRYNDIRTLFVEVCMQYDVFNCIYKSIQPENFGIVNDIETHQFYQ